MMASAVKTFTLPYSCFSDDLEQIEADSAWLREVAQTTGGVTEMAAHDGSAFEDGYEHFGYRDGLTDVPIEGTEEIYPQPPGSGTRQPDGSWAADQARRIPARLRE